MINNVDFNKKKMFLFTKMHLLIIVSGVIIDD